MRTEVSVELECGVDEVRTWVDDLTRFTSWTELLHDVSTQTPAQGELAAWSVELRGKLGPFARSKRLRMARVATESPEHLRFERREIDTGSHGQWNLDVRLAAGGTRATTLVVMHLEYEGRLWSGAVERLLHNDIETSKRRLAEVVSRGNPVD